MFHRIWRSSVLPVVICVHVALPSVAHAQFFHDAELETRTKSAIEEYRASKKAHLEFIDARLSQIDAQQTALSAAAVETTIAERDADIVRIFGEDDRKEMADRLTGELRSRIAIIVPGVEASEMAALRAFWNQYEAGPDPLRATPTDLKTYVDDILAAFKDKRKPTDNQPDAPPQDKWTVPWYCQSVYLRAVDRAGGDQDAMEPEFIRRVLIDEAHLAQSKANEIVSHSRDACSDIVRAAYGIPLPPLTNDNTKWAVSALLGRSLPKEVRDAERSGAFDWMPAIRLGVQMSDVEERTKALKQELSNAEKAAKTLKTEQDKLTRLWNTNARALQLARVACLTRALVDDSDPKKCPASVADPADEGGDSKDDKKDKDTEREQPTEVNFEDFRQVRTALTELSALGPELEALKQGAVFEIVQYLSDPATLHEKAGKECSPGADPVPEGAARRKAERLCITDAIVLLLDYFERNGEIRDGVPGRIAELAVLLAEAQLKANQIRLRANALSRRATNLEARRKALIAELLSLLEAYGDNGAKAAPAHRDRAVYRLGESVRLGRADYARLAAEYGFIGQREFAEREKAITTARYEIADALLATLSAYSEAGIKPEDIAAFLAALGITTVAIKELAE